MLPPLLPHRLWIGFSWREGLLLLVLLVANQNPNVLVLLLSQKGKIALARLGGQVMK